MFKMNVGIDLVELDRFSKILEDTPTFLDKVFHKEEIKKLNVQSIGGKYAAKEALVKAGVIKPGQWLDVFIDTLDSGKPVVRNRLGIIMKNIDISITHIASVAAAVVIYEHENI